MPERPTISHLSLKVEGSAPPRDVMASLVDVTVDHTLHMPSMFAIRLFSHDMRWVEDATFREGKKVEIFLGEPPVKVLSGKIAGLEPELDEGSPALVVRGYDLFHKLYRGRKRRSFVQVTDADLARQIASECSLTPGTIDATTKVHEYVFQNNQTNAEFLLERAQRVGYELWVDDDKLHFRRPQPNGSPVQLAWGENLRSFNARLSTAEQLDEVEVRGWDPKQKRKVVGRATRGRGAPEIGARNGAAAANRAWGEAKWAIVDEFVQSPAEAEALAQAKLDESASSYVEAEGTCDANPDITPGRQVEIRGVGQRFGGTYYVTRVTHEWTKLGGAVTHFTASGRRDRSLLSLFEDRTPPAAAAGHGMGLVIGLVTDNKDPEELGRVRVSFPWLSDNNESAWARVVAPMAGGGRGHFYLPEVDDEVLLGFEHGDFHRPFVIGSLWNGRDATPLTAADAVGGDGKVNKRIVKSRSGHTILLDDTAGGEEITIVDKTGNNKIVVHSPDNSMDIQVQGDLTLEAKGKVIIKGMAGVEMSSNAAVEVKGTSGVEVSSQAQLKLKGQAGAELDGGPQTSVKGVMVEIQGSGAVRVTGALVTLN